MVEINIGTALTPGVVNTLRGVGSLHGIKETPGLPFESLQEKFHQTEVAEETINTIGHLLLSKLAGELSQLPPLTGNLILHLRATTKEEANA